jgi:glycosyltransferase involved in cell wall biosynthesis
VSHVDPTVRHSGQQQRVYYSLVALREHFHITFLTFAESTQRSEISKRLKEVCDDAEVLPSAYNRNLLSKAFHRLSSIRYQQQTGLKLSNYVIGQVEFNPRRVADCLGNGRFDLALFEYFHAADCAPLLQQRGCCCVLDMHNVLWQSFAKQLDAKGITGEKERGAVARYRLAEESAWEKFDALIAISAGERDYVKTKVLDGQRVLYAPMGVPLDDWPYSWSPAQPPRLAYYGGMGSPHNAQDARRCYEEIMPAVWRVIPEAEFWIVGGNPPPDLCALGRSNPNVKVTGFVQNVQDVLKTMSVLLCPFNGTYGFRSRVIEAMALGVPVVATADAVYGMDLENGRGLILCQTSAELTQGALRLLENADFAKAESCAARGQVEQKYGFEASYGRMAKELLELAQANSSSTVSSAPRDGQRTGRPITEMNEIRG